MNSLLFPHWTQFLTLYQQSLSPSSMSSSPSHHPNDSLFSTTLPRTNPLASLSAESIPRTLWSLHVKQPSSSLLTAISITFLYTYTPRGTYTEFFGYLLGYCARAGQWRACRTILGVMRKVISTASTLFSDLYVMISDVHL